MEENNYRQTKSPINSSLTVVQNEDYKWGAVDADGNTVVPFGKYAWMDGFRNGLAKVIGFNDNTSPNIVARFKVGDNGMEHDNTVVEEQGVINENGEEVLPLEYTVWKFYGKDFPTIKTFKDGEERTYRFEELNPAYRDPADDYEDDSDSRWYYDDGPDYDEMARDTWDAMTDGQYGDMPDGFDGDYSFLGY